MMNKRENKNNDYLAKLLLVNSRVLSELRRIIFFRMSVVARALMISIFVILIALSTVSPIVLGLDYVQRSNDKGGSGFHIADTNGSSSTTAGMPRIVGQGSKDDGRCNCIVMRLDDVQDEWIRDVQLELLDTLISNQVHTAVGLVMHAFGDDAAIVTKVREGGKSGLFEYDIHGWDHVDYSTLSLEEQRSSLAQAKAKLVRTLGKDSNVFIPPYQNFSENTLSAMDQLGMTIISADDTQNFPPAPRKSPLYPHIVHMPQTIDFADQVGKLKVLKPLKDIVSAVDKDIEDKGYAVLTLHPQDFALYNGTKAEDVVNQLPMNELKQFIQIARQEGLSFAGFQEALDMNHPNLSTLPDLSNPYEKILSPSPNSSIPAGSTIKITGSAFDDTKIASVDLRITNSSYSTTSTANNFMNWTKFISAPPTSGNIEIVVRATDIAGRQTWVKEQVRITQNSSSIDFPI